MLETRKGLRPSLLHIYHDVFEKDVPVLLKMPLAFDNPQGLRRMALWVRGGIAKISTMADNNPSLKGLGNPPTIPSIAPGRKLLAPGLGS